MRHLMTAAALTMMLVRPVSAADEVEVADIAPRDGWQVIATDRSFDALLDSLRAAVPAAGMGLVTEAGPTETAAGRGITIPGNRVVGVFNNDFAVRTLALSTAAMIEAPIRFYVTEDGDGGASLSWKRPGTVFAPYMDDAGPGLAEIAAELDAKFEEIAAAATGR
jgi:uncharacterized protein (DUF302 family)